MQGIYLSGETYETKIALVIIEIDVNYLELVSFVGELVSFDNA
jgi:hypothetical protein